MKKQSATCFTGLGAQADVLGRFEDFKKHDRINPFTAEEYYFLRNNLPSVNDEGEKRRPKHSLDSMTSLRGLQDAKNVRESMKQFSKDNDVIHVTIDRISLAQLTKLSERDIRRDRNVKLVTNRNENQSTLSKKDEEGRSIKTMYGTFNE